MCHAREWAYLYILLKEIFSCERHCDFSYTVYWAILAILYDQSPGFPYWGMYIKDFQFRFIGE